MKRLTCECCGAPLRKKEAGIKSIYICEYCGATYEVENENSLNPTCIRIETFTNPVQVLKCVYEVPQNFILMYGDDAAQNLAKKVMATNLAESLLPYMDFETEYDPRNRVYINRARVRLVEGGHKF